MYAEPNWGMDNVKRHKDCPFRTKLANCDAVGGFCTSVNETICEGIHKALKMNTREKGKWIRNDNGTYSCSLCQSWIPEEQYHYARFCLHCGARMESEEK